MPSPRPAQQHAALGSGISADALKGDVTIESEVSSDLTVGLEYDHGDSNSIKSVSECVRYGGRASAGAPRGAVTSPYPW